MKTVAILGASADRNKFGNKAVRAFHQCGFRVFPVHPRETSIEGLKVYSSIRDLPIRPDWVSVYLPPSITLDVLPEIAERGCDSLWLNPGTESPEILTTAERLGLNVVQGCSILAVGVSPSTL